MKKDGGPKKMKAGGKKKISYLAKKGGAKPDYLDMDGDGNKTESMKSAVASKKSKKKMGGKAPEKKMMGGKKKMMKGGKKKMMMGGKNKMGMGGNKMMYKSGGFLEMPVFDLDRD